MYAQGMSALIVVGLAGSALAGPDPIQLEPSRGEVRHAGHIYFNVATGEKITTLIGAGDTQGAAAGDPGTEIWIQDTGAQCLEYGYSTSYFFALDAQTGTSGTGTIPNKINFDWGDIEMNTVVDCVQIHWISDHADTDTDGDSLADGVEGFSANWTYWDGMQGRSPQLESIAMPVIDFRFYSLPGEYPVDTTTIAIWTADIDLGGTFGTSLTFELGDTDSDLQGADVHNARMDLRDEDSDLIPDIDPDEDGLADWGWSIQFVQPGMMDVDNADSDSDTQTGIDGDIFAMATAGIAFGSPTPGHAEFDSVAGIWEWVSDGPTAGVTEDAFALGLTGNPDGSGELTIIGTFWFGGLDCSAGQTDGYNPAAHFQVVLYAGGEPPHCPIDLGGNPDGSPDGQFSFIDISIYLNWLSTGDLRADITGPVDCVPDGRLNFLDISKFVMLIREGCGNFP